MSDEWLTETEETTLPLCYVVLVCGVRHSAPVMARQFLKDEPRTVAYIGVPFCEGQNLEGADLAAVQHGNRLMRACLDVIELADRLGVPWILEQPHTSYAWLTDRLVRLASRPTN